MTKKINRRVFLASTLASTAGGIASGATLKTNPLFSQENGTSEACVAEILRLHFQLGPEYNELVKKFHSSLASGEGHTESADYFNELLKNPSRREDLETYVIQEFVVSTNFLDDNHGSSNPLAISES